MNTIKLNKVNVKNNIVSYDYEVCGECSVYFHIETKMQIEYSIKIDNVPQSVLVVPFISNILPIIWLCDAILYVEEVDKDFFENLELVKKGYIDMYPMLSFKGKIKAEKIVENRSSNQNASAVFFSGGVDAYTTLLRHVEKKPYLVTLWGSDVKLDDIDGWKNVDNHIKKVSKEYNLENVVVKSNFRSIIHEGKLSNLVKDSGDGWWHGFQHGVAIIGHMAPIANMLNLKYAYIASSYPQKMKGQYTCASDPSIDNFVRYSGCQTIHDGCELDRQEKIRFLVSKKKEGYPISLRVCWISSGGKNCCRCEKCYRTILEIVSEAGNPNEYGFIWDEKAIAHCKKDMLTKLEIKDFQIEQYYRPLSKIFIQNKSRILEFDKYKWLLNMDFSRFNNYPMKKIRRTFLYRGLRKIYRILIKK